MDVVSSWQQSVRDTWTLGVPRTTSRARGHWMYDFLYFGNLGSVKFTEIRHSNLGFFVGADSVIET